ncbi:hypothetical protein [Haloarcula onubensis]|uniref:Uncharacterized protein n=1 Tax=Haloarcula onubensis TaxID=2950539 RepID=A0ABU2FL81_9EURY|nr:hypothetical protein [Halomicroarcula sp. S3CR25-11]MDS0281072.1 hypothetical protein [Halomicroarcula sp. S3CR25-11]
METHAGRFRVYRVVESVPHINLFDTEATRLYTAYQSGYGDRQDDIDALRTGDLVEATLGGDPDDPDEAWSVQSVERVGGVRMAFAVDADPPTVAADLWTEGQERPSTTALRWAGDPVAEVAVQPRAPLPGGAFVPSVLTGLVPMEDRLGTLSSGGEPVTDALFLDPDPPDTDRYSRPYGTAVFFGAAGEALRDEFYDRYGIDPTGDSRPEYDPYGI